MGSLSSDVCVSGPMVEKPAKSCPKIVRDIGLAESSVLSYTAFTALSARSDQISKFQHILSAPLLTKAFMCAIQRDNTT